MKFADLCLGGTVRLRDAYEQKDMGEYADQLELTLPAHATRIFVAEADSRTERTRYEAETAYISDYQELKNNQAERTGIYEAGINFSSGYKAGWLGCSEQNDLVWRDVYSQQGGEYNLTIGYLSGENRNITVSVNGTEVQTVNVNSGGWGTVAGKKLKVRLQKGYNVIRLSNAASWMPDIDYIDLVCTSSDGIDSTPTHSSALQGRSYDLQGRPVKAHAKGIVIVDGKKEVVRP